MWLGRRVSAGSQQGRGLHLACGDLCFGGACCWHGGVHCTKQHRMHSGSKLCWMVDTLSQIC